MNEQCQFGGVEFNCSMYSSIVKLNFRQFVRISKDRFFFFQIDLTVLCIGVLSKFKVERSRQCRLHFLAKVILSTVKNSILNGRGVFPFRLLIYIYI